MRAGGRLTGKDVYLVVAVGGQLLLAALDRGVAAKQAEPRRRVRQLLDLCRRQERAEG